MNEYRFRLLDHIWLALIWVALTAAVVVLLPLFAWEWINDKAEAMDDLGRERMK